ncbi:MAG: LptF/LptG family permease [Paludibacteraceae bacterium]|nr:LptF/LptG family permease [Paludibacteraceae bacterium]
MIKKLDIYMLRNFMGLFILTFMICCFILLMQFLWMHVNDLVGKGVELSVLMEFFVYATMSVIPLALPLAILLASLMTFGNLGEKFELTAMKSAGVSLFRIMRPLMIFIGMVSVGAFFFSNHVLPASQAKLWALIFSLRQKSPELDIPVAEFYDGVQGYNIYVRKKNPRTGLMENMMIYDYSNGFENAGVTVADSGRVFFTEDNRYLLLKLYNGESFENLNQEQQRATGTQKSVPYRRETFREKQILIDFNTELERYDASVLDDQHVSKNVRQLVQSIDSVSVLSKERSAEQGRNLTQNNYFGRERMSGRELTPVEESQKKTFSIEALRQSLRPEQLRNAYRVAIDKAQNQRNTVEYNAAMLDDYNSYIRKHQIELYRKYTLSFACLIFFFIGAPLGAIIRKGGLGAPIVISVVMFIIYYIIDNTGYKMAREGLWAVWQGMWLSSAVLLPIGVFLTYKAATDSGLFNPEVWIKIYEKVVENIKNKWIALRTR